MQSSIPSEEELRAALQALRAQNPSLGTSKLHALVLSEHPTWSVSEKRTKKILQNEGLVLKPTAPATPTHDASGNTTHPVSRVIEGFNVEKWTPKVQVRFFNRHKGKGLVATERITEGEVLWKEDPFVLAPEWYERVPIYRFSICLNTNHHMPPGPYTISKQPRLCAHIALHH